MPAPFSHQLLRWYDANRADRPWRRHPTPYHIWLAEVMLQQTQVDTVIPYYERFLAAFPSLEDLAAASLDDMLKLWEGLGYYSRARNLHRAARIVAAEMNGQLPSAAADLMRLPGIGRYTAGAISSIAFGQPVPILDGNLTRIFTRLQDIDGDIRQRESQEALWRLAEDWLPRERPGDYNQALMELGQRICRPRQPRCDICPIREHCKSYAAGTQSLRPHKSKRPAIPHFDVCAGLIRDQRGHLLIAQRPLDGLLGGLWEFPGGKRQAGESLKACLARELREELAIEVEVGERFTLVKHAFTHFRITLHAFDCRYLGALPPHAEPQAIEALAWAWARLDELDDYSFGKADRMVIAALRERCARPGPA